MSLVFRSGVGAGGRVGGRLLESIAALVEGNTQYLQTVASEAEELSKRRSELSQAAEKAFLAWRLAACALLLCYLERMARLGADLGAYR